MRPEPSFARSVVAWGNACLAGRLPLEEFDAWWPRTVFVRRLSFHDGDRVVGLGASWLASLGDTNEAPARLVLDASGLTGCEAVVVCREAPVASWRQQWDRIADAKTAPWFDAIFTREPPPTVTPSPGRQVDAVLASLMAALEGLVALSQDRKSVV